MKFWTRWFGKDTLPPAQLAPRIAAWKALSPVDPATPLLATRLVVADTETSGLNPHSDRLLSIGAVGIHASRVLLADSFDIVLRQRQPSAHANIVVHGIGEAAQRSGENPAEALLQFLEFSGKCPLLAYHAPFDAAFIKRAALEHLGLSVVLDWLDLATLLPNLFNEKPLQALDFWLEKFTIDVPVRHSALGDALATAQLAQIALTLAKARGLLHFGALSRLAADSRWLPR